MPWFLPSFLTPTFFFLGLAAISLPILFHFFRRTPRGTLNFSTLMFLQPSPPRLTRRSRVDNWILLLLRGLILLFIALAFGRVFFRQTDFLNISDLPQRRVAILVDTSASMKRGDLWSQASAAVREVLDSLGPNDEAALYAFDSEWVPLVGFSSDSSVQVSAQRDLMLSALDSQVPRWKSTDLGTALIQASEALERDLDNDSRDRIADSQIVVISDLQAGSDLKALQSFEWSQKIPVELKFLQLDEQNNATLGLMQDLKQGSRDNKLRVRVSNVAEATTTQFELAWMKADGSEGEAAGNIVVPPGQSRIVYLSPPAESIGGLMLKGDEFDFDNRYFVAYPQPALERILFVGQDESVRSQLKFYLEKACSSLIGRRFEFLDADSFSADSQATIVFITGALEESETERLREFASSGGLVCHVVTSPEMKPTLDQFFNTRATVEQGESGYVLLADIDFGHRLFSRFADPKFSNFQNIRFWKHRQVEVPGWSPIASFDNDAVAIAEMPVGEGSAFIFTSGWHPTDSQFALSTKFVGVMMSLMLKQITRENLNFELGKPFAASRFVEAGQEAFLQQVTGEGAEDEPGALIQLGTIDETDQVLTEVESPGIYEITSGDESKLLAFNLPRSESQTRPLETELLEQSGIRLGTMNSAEKIVELERQRRDTELEGQQKLWRWMLVAALLALFAETLLSGFFARRQVLHDAVQEA